MLNCLCWKQIENNMFALLNNFETFIFLSQRTFFTEALTQMQVFLAKDLHTKARWTICDEMNGCFPNKFYKIILESCFADSVCYSYYWDVVKN